MKDWLKALRSETLISVWSILSALSTLATFFISGLSGKPRLVSAISAILGFAWANFRVFQKQQREISKLKDALSTHEARVSNLRITPGARSRYILRPAGITNAEFNGGYFEFHLMIENTGRRDSTVNNYKVEIVELNQTFPNLAPMEGQSMVQGRHAHMGLYAAGLSVTQNVRVPAENSTNRGTLLFLIPDINMQQFVQAGLSMHGERMYFDPLHCHLTLTDTTGSSTTCDFVLQEE